MQVYNSLTRRKEPLELPEEGVVRMHNCGPTVYGRQHIGNFRSFLFADLLRRWLEYQGLRVIQVMNITDVGHLTDDADMDGDDKIEAQARREKKDPQKIADSYAEMFLADIAELGVRPPELYPRASDHIPEMLGIIEDLIEKGFAYESGSNVYFDVTKFAAYGRLSGNKVADLEAGARIEVREDKRHPADFALWKSDPHHLMKWPSRFGPDGFPGWHIECSAMALKHLGEQIDIHTGGEDNVFPHHECEIAQSECHTGKPFARYWMHAKFLQVDGGKMAKSLGNIYTLDDVRERGFTVRALRYCLIRGHYRQPLNFTWDILAESAAALEGLDDLVVRLRRAAGDAEPDHGAAAVEEARGAFEGALGDDLNMPEALGALFGLRQAVVREGLEPRAAAAGLELVLRANEVLGVMDTEEQTIDSDVEELIEARRRAREDKDWAEADRIRDALLERSITLEDAPEGTLWRRE